MEFHNQPSMLAADVISLLSGSGVGQPQRALGSVRMAAVSELIEGACRGWGWWHLLLSSCYDSQNGLGKGHRERRCEGGPDLDQILDPGWTR